MVTYFTRHISSLRAFLYYIQAAIKSNKHDFLSSCLLFISYLQRPLCMLNKAKTEPMFLLFLEHILRFLQQRRAVVAAAWTACTWKTCDRQ